METFRTAEKIIGVHQDLHTSWDRKRAGKTITGPSHPEHDLCELLPSGRHYGSLCAKTSRESRHMNCFTPQAVTLTHTQTCDMFCLWTNNLEHHMTPWVDQPKILKIKILCHDSSCCELRRWHARVTKRVPMLQCFCAFILKFLSVYLYSQLCNQGLCES